MNDKYLIVKNMAWEELRGKDIQQAIQNCSARILNKDEILLSYFGKPCQINLSAKNISCPAYSLSIFDEILILHYIIKAKEVESVGKWVTFQELPDGRFYYGVFQNRAPLRLLSKFPSGMPDINLLCQNPSIEKFEYSDWGIIVQVFPKVKVAITVWYGDDELASTANMLFDPTILNFLHIEDVAVLGERIVDYLSKEATK